MQIKKPTCTFTQMYLASKSVKSMAATQLLAGVHQLPEIIVLGPPAVFRTYDKEFSSKFRVLRPWLSPLPLPEFLAAEAQNTQAAVCCGYFMLSAAILRHLPSLRVVVNSTVGLDHLDLHECRRRGIAVTNAGTVFSADVADLAVALLLDVHRKIRNGLWPEQGSYPLGFKLGGKKVGIVGLGSIGLEIAKRLQAFGCAISYYSRKKKPCVSYKFIQDIYELAANSDILVLCCALTEQTRGLINREVILALGKDGVIVNIGRGALIDEPGLVSCLQQGEIGGAGLDVFANEPCVPREFFDLDNVVLSPHNATLTKESMRDIYELMCENLEAFFTGKPLLTLVTEE